MGCNASCGGPLGLNDMACPYPVKSIPKYLLLVPIPSKVVSSLIIYIKHNTMKSLSTRSSVLVVVVALVFLACSGNESNSGTTQTPATTTTPAVPLQNPTAVASGVDHYTCPNGHTGAAAAGSCATCGVALEHNPAYHNNDAAANPQISTTPATPATPAADSPAQNAAGVYHYTCPNGHPGAGAAGNCSSCGSALAHNQAYHNTPGAPATPSTATPAAGGTFAPMLQKNQGTPAGQVQTPTVTTASPAQNAAGVYHYTCPNGHPGAGAAGNCSSCGSALSHNQAYHN